LETRPENQPSLSLVVATLGRRQELLALLQSIPSEQRFAIEVVVVDQNAEGLSAELAPFSDYLRLKHLPVSFCNANAARNLGAEHASASWLMFPDDDARFLPETLDRALQLIQSDRFDLIGGQIVNDANVPHLLQWLPHPTEITRHTIEHTLVESSFFIRKTFFLKAGGFDPLFGPGGIFPSAEGADLMQRMWRHAGLRSRYDPAIAVYHPSKHTPSTHAGRQRIHDFAMGEGAFTMRHYRILPLLTIGRKLLFRMAGTMVCRGERRLCKLAYLRGFFLGAYRYCGLRPSPHLQLQSFEGIINP
jgi:glycosyltransferase involved in cell wall biosynthesis